MVGNVGLTPISLPTIRRLCHEESALRIQKQSLYGGEVMPVLDVDQISEVFA
jgi:hypothetical protein